MKLALIVAMAQNRVIGVNNKLPWYLPNDLKYFKAITMGKPIIMGRKTYDSIGKPLPGRTNIIITRDQNYSAEGCSIVHSLDQALTLAESVAVIDGQEEVIVIGGEQIYQLALPRADRLYLTRVIANISGDAYFPEIDSGDWQETASEGFEAEGPNPYDYSFTVLDRVSSQS